MMLAFWSQGTCFLDPLGGEHSCHCSLCAPWVGKAYFGAGALLGLVHECMCLFVCLLVCLLVCVLVCVLVCFLFSIGSCFLRKLEGIEPQANIVRMKPTNEVSLSHPASVLFVMSRDNHVTMNYIRSWSRAAGSSSTPNGCTRTRAGRCTSAARSTWLTSCAAVGSGASSSRSAQPTLVYGNDIDEHFCVRRKCVCEGTK